jgi:hypothetical protein
MTRKDSEKDTDRPHYYSQFWLDVAAGRKVIGGPKVEEEAETEAEIPELEPTPLRKTGRGSITSVTDGYKETRAQTAIEPEFAPEEFAEPEDEELGLSNGVDDLEIPNILVEETLAETAVSDLNVAPEEEEEAGEEEEEFFFDEEEEEEEEEEDDWSARGRKKPKPGRQVKAPKPVKKPKRETRRGF